MNQLTKRKRISVDTKLRLTGQIPISSFFRLAIVTHICDQIVARRL